jgi:hypothetical protein
MLTLNDKENEYAINIKHLIEQRGFSQLAKTEFDAGFLSENEMLKVFQYLKQEGWELADELIAADAHLVAELTSNFNLDQKKSKSKTITKADLMRRIRNNFSTSEIRNLKLYHRPEEEVIPLLKEREKERYGR